MSGPFLFGLRSTAVDSWGDGSAKLEGESHLCLSDLSAFMCAVLRAAARNTCAGIQTHLSVLKFESSNARWFEDDGPQEEASKE